MMSFMWKSQSTWHRLSFTTKKQQESLFNILCTRKAKPSLKKWLTNYASITCQVAKLGIEPKVFGT